MGCTPFQDASAAKARAAFLRLSDMFLNRHDPQNLTDARHQVEREDIARSYTLLSPSDFFIACNTDARPTTRGGRAFNRTAGYRLFAAPEDDGLNAPIGSSESNCDLQTAVPECPSWG
jgi:hypothetical protein